MDAVHVLRAARGQQRNRDHRPGGLHAEDHEASGSRQHARAFDREQAVRDRWLMVREGRGIHAVRAEARAAVVADADVAVAAQQRPSLAHRDQLVPAPKSDRRQW